MQIARAPRQRAEDTASRGAPKPSYAPSTVSTVSQLSIRFALVQRVHRERAQSSTHSLRIAIASSIPLSQPSVFADSCSMTVGARSSWRDDLARANEVRVAEEARANLFDRKLERAGSSRLRAVGASKGRVLFRGEAPSDVDRGCVIVSGSSARSSCSRVISPRAITTSYTPRPASSASLRPRRLLVADHRHQRRDDADRVLDEMAHARSGFAVMPSTHRSRSTAQPFCSVSMLRSRRIGDHRLEHVELQLARLGGHA